jgi:threonine/homoserine/homoserine lactone efflux protein
MMIEKRLLLFIVKRFGFNFEIEDIDCEGRRSFRGGLIPYCLTCEIRVGNPKAILFHLGFMPTFFNLTVIGMMAAILDILFSFIKHWSNSFLSILVISGLRSL